MPAASPAPGSWICSSCGSGNSSLTPGFCPVCGDPRDGYLGGGGRSQYSSNASNRNTPRYSHQPYHPETAEEPSQLSSQKAARGSSNISKQNVQHFSHTLEEEFVRDEDQGSDEESIFTDCSSPSTTASSFDGDAEAVEELVDVLWNKPLFKGLLIQALSESYSEVGSFERKLRHLLNRFVRNLRSEAASKEQHQVSKFLARKSGSVSLLLLNRAQLQAMPKIKTRSSKPEQSHIRKSGGSLDGYLSNSDEDDEARQVEETNDDEQSNITRHKNFLTESSAFLMFYQSLLNVVHPTLSSSLLDFSQHFKRTRKDPEKYWVAVALLLSRELRRIPLHHITISRNGNIGWGNKLKAVTETLTGQAWNWWPLGPAYQPLGKYQARIHWICTCGDKRWLEAPESFVAALERLIEQLAANHEQNRTAIPLQKVTASTSTSQSGPIQSQSPPIQGQMSQHIIPSQSLQITTSSISGLQIPYSLQGRVLFVVRSRKDYRLAQLNVHGITTRQFFTTLRSEYTRLRGLLCYYLGIWCFSHCDFYEFVQFDELAIAPKKKNQYPPHQDQDYEYRPKPITDIPPITKHEFKKRFDACTSKAFHLRCTKSCHCAKLKNTAHNHEILYLLPKKLSQLDEKTDHRQVFWGLYARQEIHFSRVLAYNVVCISPLIWFLIMWLVVWGDGKDLESASLPLMIMLTFLTLFWTTFIVCLKSDRDIY